MTGANPAVAALEAALLERIDPDRMMRDVAYLSTLRRHSGTPDEAAAFAYIARECRAAGIADRPPRARHRGTGWWFSPRRCT